MDTDRYHTPGSTENCQICNGKLIYFAEGKELKCFRCGKTEVANIICSNGHYICDACHGKDVFDLIRDYVLTTTIKNPLEIAETLMNYRDKVPMLGCENAWIAAGSFMAAIKNEGMLKITSDQIHEVLNRTRRQAIGGYCGLTGVCGIAPAIGACFSVILGAACPKDRETATTMQVVSKIITVIARETGPCCCKNFVRTALAESAQLAGEYLHITVSTALPGPIICEHVERHPHGCRKERCAFYPNR
ncbi:hypothetical protein SPSYN_01643 [Sporotomaculum syntrophicum]|uniref:DUF5714 domain-containing protein n=1 Tax=Sporotomaculum syntrophicum TaxID=182264 RepID=A0A9D2WRB8_9FIRM|nr:DUF5714 domain-containing protein [Sporotomaculum syntrophicum]KAF1085501.1 hypothetical protein SPSYN_01643 [Sporotomaculum syntrophicum]